MAYGDNFLYNALSGMSGWGDRGGDPMQRPPAQNQQMISTGNTLADKQLSTKDGITTGAGAIGHVLNAIRGEYLRQNAFKNIGGQTTRAGGQVGSAYSNASGSPPYTPPSPLTIPGGTNSSLPQVPGILIDKGIPTQMGDYGSAGGNMSTNQQTGSVMDRYPSTVLGDAGITNNFDRTSAMYDPSSVARLLSIG